jgi:hypothetical protein
MGNSVPIRSAIRFLLSQQTEPSQPGTAITATSTIKLNLAQPVAMTLDNDLAASGTTSRFSGTSRNITAIDMFQTLG